MAAAERAAAASGVFGAPSVTEFRITGARSGVFPARGDGPAPIVMPDMTASGDFCAIGRNGTFRELQNGEVRAVTY